MPKIGVEVVTLALQSSCVSLTETSPDVGASLDT